MTMLANMVSILQTVIAVAAGSTTAAVIAIAVAAIVW